MNLTNLSQYDFLHLHRFEKRVNAIKALILLLLNFLIQWSKLEVMSQKLHL